MTESTELINALRIILAERHAASVFSKYVTSRDLRLRFGMCSRTIQNMKRNGLTPVNSGTKLDIFRAADIEAHLERPVTFPSRGKKRKPRAK